MLEHLTPGNTAETLTGDLQEEFGSGRSVAWYWRQVLAAVVIDCLRAARRRGYEIVFAALWSMLAPAWLLLAANATEQAAHNWRVWQFDWPWSAVCSLFMSAAPGLIFVLAGLASYQIPELNNVRGKVILRLGMRFTLTAFVFIAISAVVAWSAILFPIGGRLTSSPGPTLSFAPEPPSFTPNALGGGRDIRVIHTEHGVPSVQVTTRVYIESHPFWVPKSFRLDRSTAAVAPTTALEAIEEVGLAPLLNRLTVFFCLLFALWKKPPKQREGHP
jgi:hypothetical protein